jgi:hypothetical protein
LQATEQYRQLVASSYAAALSLQEWQVNIDSISCAGNIVFNSTTAAGQASGTVVIESSSTGTRRMLLQDDISSTTWDVTTATAANSDERLGSTPTETAGVVGWDQDQSAVPPAETAVEVVTVFTVQVPVSSAGNAHVTEAVLQHSTNILSGPLSSFFAAAGAPIQSAMRLAGSGSSNDAGGVTAVLTGVDGAAAGAGGLVFESAAISLTDDAYAAAMAASVAPAPAPTPAAPVAPAQDDTAEHGIQAAAEGDSATAAAAEHQLPGIPDDSSPPAAVLVDQLLDQQQQQQQQNVASTEADNTTEHTPADVPQHEQQVDAWVAAAAPTHTTPDMSAAPAVEVTAADQPTAEQPTWSGADEDAARAIIVTKMIEAAAAAAAQSRAHAIEAIRELA